MIKFKDIYGTELELFISPSSYIRINIEGADWVKKKHPKTGEEITNCISMNENQARIMISGIKELLDRLED